MLREVKFKPSSFVERSPRRFLDVFEKSSGPPFDKISRDPCNPEMLLDLSSLSIKKKITYIGTNPDFRNGIIFMLESGFRQKFKAVLEILQLYSLQHSSVLS